MRSRCVVPLSAAECRRVPLSGAELPLIVVPTLAGGGRGEARRVPAKRTHDARVEPCQGEPRRIR